MENKQDPEDKSTPEVLKKYLEETFSKICKGEGEIKRMSQYGGSFFVIFENNRTYRLNMELYNNEVTLD